jgi:hypothetical protein
MSIHTISILRKNQITFGCELKFFFCVSESLYDAFILSRSLQPNQEQLHVLLI